MTIVQNDKTSKKWIFKPLSGSLHEISELFNESSAEAQNALSIALTTAAIRMVEGIANTIIFSIPINDIPKQPEGKPTPPKTNSSGCLGINLIFQRSS